MAETQKSGVEELEFEEALKQLSEIVAKLESEEVGLEEAISLFEKGSKLSQHCAGVLEEAELKIEKVNKDKDQD